MRTAHQQELVRGTNGNRYVDGPLADNTANRTLVDTRINSSYTAFVGNTGSYPPVPSADFASSYRTIATKANPVDQGATPTSAVAARDIDGAARVGVGRSTSGRSSTGDAAHGPEAVRPAPP